MNMYSRFKDSLVAPSNIVKYIKDKNSIVFSYFFLLIIFLTLPVVIFEISYFGLTSGQITNLSNNYSEKLSGPYEIVDNKLVIDINNYDLVKYIEIDYYTIGIINTPSRLLNYYYRITFTENGLNYVSLIGDVRKTYSYNELGIDNFDFDDISKANIDKFIKAINVVVKDNQTSYKMMMIAGSFFAGIFEVLILILLIALLNRHPMPYKLKLKLMFYAITPYIILTFFGTVFNLGFISFIGIILSSIYLRKATEKIMVL